MTCIVGIKHEGMVIMGGDSACSSGNEVYTLPDKKIFTKHITTGVKFIFGVSGTDRTLQILQHVLEMPVVGPKDRDCIQAYLIKKFVPALIKCMAVGEVLKKESGIAKSDSVILCGYKHGLYRINNDFFVRSITDEFEAIGSGEHYAKGALFAVTEGSPKDRITTALNAAARYDAGVRAPYNFVST